MATLCRECLEDLSGHRRSRQDDVCPACGGQTVSHAELLELQIAHIDADAFFASVEKRDNPDLADKPVIVGNPGRRGIVTTACYQARRFGVRSAQPIYQARKACPGAVIVPPRHDRYRAVSADIKRRMDALTPQVRFPSLDEAFLDLHGTERLHNAPPAVLLARLARDIRKELGITVSVGLSHTPLLAKLASDLDKPSGFSVIGKSDTLDILDPLPVGALPGVGGRMQSRLASIGLMTCADLRHAGRDRLEREFGAHGRQLWDQAHGRDGRVITPNAPARSISNETTFVSDTSCRRQLARHLWPLVETVAGRAKKAGVAGGTVTLKAKRTDHTLVTRQSSLPVQTQLAEDIFETGCRLLDKLADGTAYRLLGIGLGDLVPETQVVRQHDMFTSADRDRRERAERAVDAIRERYGADAISRGRGLG